ncbi:hypothetical protein M9Y10_036149 [Tritrichomonas musculus]|uniref:Major facilitator superfamily (MFS) profile domain-containing protein n=1 Tax=Tritrichomonas musculus TaxID=1915356 RepID=A0ABR2GVC6_9EUKA
MIDSVKRLLDIYEPYQHIHTQKKILYSLVGVGCGPLYSPCNRVLINWFPLEHYSKILGLFNSTAGCGLLLAQTPLTLLSQAIGWRWCFFLIAIISVLLATTYLIFVKGNPVSNGYPAVNDSLIKDSKSTSTKEKMHQILNNMTTIISNPNFWLLGFFVFFENGAFYNVTGIWGGPYLKEMHGYDSVKASNALLGLSVGFCFGSLLNPYLPYLPCNAKKETLLIGTAVAIGCCIPLGFFTKSLTYVVVILLLTVHAILTAGLGTVTFPFALDFFHPSVGASFAGCLNFFAFFSLIVCMPVTAKVLDCFGTLPNDPDLHSPDGFKFGIWVFSMCRLALGSIFLLFVKNRKDDQIIDNISNYHSVD